MALDWACQYSPTLRSRGRSPSPPLRAPSTTPSTPVSSLLGAEAGFAARTDRYSGPQTPSPPYFRRRRPPRHLPGRDLPELAHLQRRRVRRHQEQRHQRHDAIIPPDPRQPTTFSAGTKGPHPRHHHRRRQDRRDRRRRNRRTIPDPRRSTTLTPPKPSPSPDSPTMKLPQPDPHRQSSARSHAPPTTTKPAPKSPPPPTPPQHSPTNASPTSSAAAYTPDRRLTHAKASGQTGPVTRSWGPGGRR